MLSKKLTIKPNNQANEKQDLHSLRKKQTNSLRGPGAYPVPEKNTSFNVPSRREHHQFFNTTASRFPNEGVNSSMRVNPIVGPGTYEAANDNFKKSIAQTRANTAAFLTKRNQNLFGV